MRDRKSEIVEEKNWEEKEIVRRRNVKERRRRMG